MKIAMKILKNRYAGRECKGCQSFAHDVSFTHDAIMDLSAPVAVSPRTFDLCEYSYHELAYLHGVDAPNYPVPATIGAARGSSVWVVLWQQGAIDDKLMQELFRKEYQL